MIDSFSILSPSPNLEAGVDMLPIILATRLSGVNPVFLLPGARVSCRRQSRASSPALAHFQRVSAWYIFSQSSSPIAIRSLVLKPGSLFSKVPREPKGSTLVKGGSQGRDPSAQERAADP